MGPNNASENKILYLSLFTKDTYRKPGLEYRRFRSVGSKMSDAYKTCPKLSIVTNR